MPATRYELAEWKGCRVNIDHHAEVDHNFYSVPYQLVHERVDARFTASTVEVFLKGRRVTMHAEWTPSRLIAWAERTGPATGPPEAVAHVKIDVRAGADAGSFGRRDPGAIDVPGGSAGLTVICVCERFR